MARKKLKDLTQAHGQTEEPAKFHNLQQILGYDGLSKYGTLDEDVYLKKLEAMGTSDLHAHAQKYGIIPVNNRPNIIKRLITEFRLYKSSFVASSNQVSDNQQTPSEEVSKILSRAR